MIIFPLWLFPWKDLHPRLVREQVMFTLLQKMAILSLQKMAILSYRSNNMAEKKFSQFAPQVNNIIPGDKLAGLRGGVNTIFTSQFGELLVARLADNTDYS